MSAVLLATLGAIPWLQGFTASAVDEQGARGVVDELAEWRAPAECAPYGGLEVATSATGDRVLASYAQGVFVLDKERHLVAQAPGFSCAGSADDLVALASGDAWLGEPVIALAATTGGRAENMTWLTLYRVGSGGELQPVFTGEVERHADHQTRTGVVITVPGAVIYRAPIGTTSIWTFDTTRGRFVEQVTFGPRV